ncbi:MAG: RsmE family RNA methyltransferase [Candidatus Delongbacteria bacterium]|nr:RsmE family RNA methyltransferase [Candidatus Delongbacteria bacterium]
MIYLVRESLNIVDGFISVSDDEAKYLLKVRRLKKGDAVHFSTSGVVYETVLNLDGRKPVFKIIRKTIGSHSSSRLFVAVASGDISAVEESVRNGVEAGADEFFIFRSEFSNTDLSVVEKRMKRLKTIVVSAASQSRRGHLPEINFSTMEEIAGIDCEHIVFHPYSPENILSYQPVDKREKMLWIGPEGGFSEKETAFFKKAGFKSFSLKTPILRMENAVTFITAFIKNII